MLNINLGGYKGFHKYSDGIKARWRTFDIDPKADYTHDRNSRKPFPFKNNEVSSYYASMIFEHIQPDNLNFIIDEIYRTLRPDGILRVVVPDICKGITAYIEGNLIWLSSSRQPTPDKNFPPTVLGRLMGWFYTASVEKKGALRSGHCMVFDWDTLRYYLMKQKFSSVKQMSFKVRSPVFEGKDFDRYAEFGLYAEAVK